MYDPVEALIKKARAQAKNLREDAETEVIAGGHNYRLEKPDRISVRLKVDHSVFGTLNNQRFGSKFFEEVANPSDSELRWLTQSCIFHISGNERYSSPNPNKSIPSLSSLNTSTSSSAAERYCQEVRSQMFLQWMPKPLPAP